ncbi:hypothetical protein GCM10010250_21830 [Streptomyces althioticus]|uniref:hypothetical protein n=1 Tax=Streptomyces althioticus TaxID=83380 RepID=UPI0018737C9B|nr:hypothetical protein GCM10010250_21830 [Streptomyces althioticus]
MAATYTTTLQDLLAGAGIDLAEVDALTHQATIGGNTWTVTASDTVDMWIITGPVAEIGIAAYTAEVAPMLASLAAIA